MKPRPPDPMTPLTVADVMARRLVTLSPEMTMLEAARLLLDARISGAPVVDAGGALVGVLSKKDCLKVVFAARYHEDQGDRVREFMSAPARTLEADLDLVSAAQHFLQSEFRRFPVMSAGRLVGQVSRYDILRALIGRF